MAGFSAVRLQQTLATYPEASSYLVAFSGGLDSTALLYALSQLQSELAAPLRAVHINHGLHPAAASWSRFCDNVCKELRIPLAILTVDACAPRGESPEEWARKARYQAIAEHMLRHELVLTAHHQDDQAETVLLQLLRGAGPAGLAAMATCKKFHQGWLGRPLLIHQRRDLHAFAEARSLTWIDDISNVDARFDRNFLRTEIMPRLRSRWPGYTEALARVARWQAEAHDAIAILAAQDLAFSRANHAAFAASFASPLSVSALRSLPDVRLRQVLRLWVKQSGLPMPTAKHVQHIALDVLSAKGDRNPRVSWSGAEIRRYRDEIFLGPTLAAVQPHWTMDWDLKSEPAIMVPGGTLYLVSDTTLTSTKASPQISKVHLRYRRGGDVCKPCGAQHSVTLKNLWQKHGVPPWLRDRWPLIIVDDAIAAVPNLVICEPLCDMQAQGRMFRWQPGPSTFVSLAHGSQAPEEN